MSTAPTAPTANISYVFMRGNTLIPRAALVDPDVLPSATQSVWYLRVRSRGASLVPMRKLGVQRTATDLRRVEHRLSEFAQALPPEIGRAHV